MSKRVSSIPNPWFHPDYEPLDPRVREFAVRAVEASGGAVDPRELSGSHDDRHAHVRDSLTRWFESAIPDLLGSPTDRLAIDCQAHNLTGCEGSGRAVEVWGKAVISHFRNHPSWPGCYEQELASRDVYAPPAIAVRGMQLYSAALTHLAQSIGLTSIRVFRGLTGAPKRWQPNALASVGWNPAHSTVRDNDVRFADIDPSVIAGITVGHECHPIIAPFSITAGPGHCQVVFEQGTQLQRQ
jgi:hypothetical protein